MRWLSEIRRPALRCERLGHKLRGEWRQGYLPGRGGWMGGVVTRVRQVRDVCARCAHETLTWTPVDGSSRAISSFKASTDIWDQIESGAGYWPSTGRCKTHFPERALLSSDPQPLGSAREATEGNPVEDELRSGVRHGRDSQGGER